MKKITLALDEDTLDAARNFASRHETTVNALVRPLLTNTIVAHRQTGVAEMFRLMDAHPGNSRNRGWTRESLYARARPSWV